jgi:GGDEF domain-containing protein
MSKGQTPVQIRSNMKVNHSKQGWAESEQLRLLADMPVMSIAYDKNLRCLFATWRFAEFFGLATVSIGIAIYPTDARDADALLKASDAAMYSAKQIGSSFRFCGM